MRKLTRREFLVLGSKVTAGAVVLGACGVPERELLVQSPVNAPEDLLNGEDAWYATGWGDGTNAEGLVARVVEGRVKKLAGNPDHPVNRGKQTARYDASLQLTYHPDRIKRPLFRRSRTGSFSELSWEAAMTMFMASASASGGRTIVTNPLTGHLGWVVSQFADRFGMRTMAFDPLEQGVLHAAMDRTLGEPRLPHLDIANASTVLSFGADWLTNWVSPAAMACAFGTFRDNDPRGYLIHAEPRFSATAAAADLWLAVRPGYEGTLALGIARYLIDNELVPDSNVVDFNARLPRGAMLGYGLPEVSRLTGVPEASISKAARQLAEYTPSLVFGGGSAGAHTNGSFNLTAIYALNTLLGGFGSEGGLHANAAPDLGQDVEAGTRAGAPHRDWNETELAQWRAGFNSTVIVRGVDLVHAMPRAAAVEDALDAVDNVIYVGGFMDDTAARANLILPESTFLESWDTAVPDPGPGYPVLTVQQPLINPADSAGETADARHFGDVLLQVMGGIGRDRSMEDVVGSAMGGLYDRSNSNGSVRATNAALFRRGVLQRGGWWNTGGGPATNAASTNPFEFDNSPNFADAPGGPGDEFHLIPFETPGIANGALGVTPWGQQVPDPMSTAAWSTWAEINSEVAARMDISEGDVLYVRSSHGEIQVIAYPNPGTPEDVIAIPIGQGRVGGGRYAEGVGSNIFDVLVDGVDEETGALAWAATRVRVLKRGNRIRLPKAEGDQGSVAVEPGVPVIVVAPGQSAEDAEHANEEEYRRQFSPGEPQDNDEHGEEGEEEGHGG